MKVKNIVFSGFAAVILANVCGNAMAASVTFTSKTYVDEGLATKADVNALAEYTKTVDLADVAITGSYDDLKNKPTFPSLDGFVSKQRLEEVQAALEVAIADKQDKGEYLEAKDLTTLNEAITALQTGKADVSTVTELQNAIASLGNTYATKADMTAADEALQAAIENINLADYVKAVNVYTKNEADARFLVMRDANALGANLQWDEDGKLNTKGIVTADGLKELEDKVADAVTQTELDTFGYQTAKDVEGAITTATADLATKSELNAKQDKLTAGDNITIEEGTISAIVDLDGLATSQELTNLQTTLQASIADKQDKGEYLEAKDLTTLNEAIVALQTGKADAQTVTDLQNAIDALGDKYATDEELGAAIAAVEAKIPTVPTKVSELENDAGYITNAALTGYAMSENVYTKGEADAKFLIMRDANALGANLQWDEDGKLNTKGIATADGLKELEDKVADAVTQTELDAIGYLTADSELNGAKIIPASVAKTALVDEVQTSLSKADSAVQEIATGTENGTIAVDGVDVPVKGLGTAAYSSADAYVVNPDLPKDNGDYMLMVEYKDGVHTYTWTNIEDYHPSSNLGGDYEL